MQDLSVNLGAYRAMLTEAPTMKTRLNSQTGEQEVVTDRRGETQFVASVFMKAVAGPGEFSRKGEEVTFNLPVDPGDGFEAGMYVELIDPRVNLYTIPDPEDARKIRSAGMWFKAAGLKPAERGGLSSAA